MMKSKRLMVSACLLGLNTKYNGGNNLKQDVLNLLQKTVFIPFCPEQLGGLPTPRAAVEIQDGDGYNVLAGTASVKTADGINCTLAFVKGAQESLQLASAVSAEGALLKARSPSCGSGCIYDGSFTGSCRAGDGVAAARLKQAGLIVFTEENLPELRLWLERDS